MAVESKSDPARIEADVVAVVRDLVEELKGTGGVHAVYADVSLEKELGLGSLERVELVSRLESRFSVKLPDSALAEAETPRQLARAVASSGGAGDVQHLKPVPVTSARPPARDAETLVEVLKRRAEAEPTRPHVYLLADPTDGSAEGREEIVTFGALYRDAVSVAGGLAALGVGAGEPVALMLPTSRDFFTAFAGALIAGGIPVPLYPPFRLDRLEEYAGRQSKILTNAGARVFVTVPRGAGMAHLLRARAPSIERVTDIGELMAHGRDAPTVEVHASSPALIQYTSGSTGTPKGVLLTHRNLLANIRAVEEALRIQSTDVGVSWLPLYHDMGLIGCWLAPLYLGVPMTILSPLAFLARPERWLWTIHRRRATVSAAPNFAYELCARRLADDVIEGLDLSCWRVALNGAEPVSPETLDRFVRRFAPLGLRAEALLPVYGLAESSLAVTTPPLDRAPRVETAARVRFEQRAEVVSARSTERAPLRFVSVGRPLPGHEVRIVDPEGREQPERKEGRLEFRGPSTMQGYYGNPGATACVLRPGGWVDSGDRAFVAEGEVFVTGRAKDLIIRGGRNLYPQEIEEIVGDVEGVRRGCVVAFGLVDEARGTEELVVVAETRADGADQKRRIAEAVQSRLSEILGLPAEHVVLVPPRTIPKTSSGKLRRSECRERFRRGELVSDRHQRLTMLELALRQAASHLRRGPSRIGSVVYGVYAVTISALLLVPTWLVTLALPGPRAAAFVRHAVRIYLRMTGIRVGVEGAEHLDAVRRGAHVLVVNHASYLDPLPLMAVLRFDYAFVVKREAASWPFVGTFIRRLGHLPIERADPQKSRATTERLADTLKQDRSVVFFPEGTFTRASGLRPFRLGAFKLAAELDRPLLPIALVGTRRWFRDGWRLPRRSSVKLIVEAPIDPHGATLEDVIELRDRAADVIARHLGEPRLDLASASIPS